MNSLKVHLAKGLQQQISVLGILHNDEHLAIK